jgi:hypothetical protein
VIRSTESRGRASKSVVPTNQSRSVGRSDRSHAVRTNRPDPVVSNRSGGRRVDAGAYSSSRAVRPSPQPRQSRPVSRPPQSRAPQSRAPESRPAPAASKPSAPA